MVSRPSTRPGPQRGPWSRRPRALLLPEAGAARSSRPRRARLEADRRGAEIAVEVFGELHVAHRGLHVIVARAAAHLRDAGEREPCDAAVTARPEVALAPKSREPHFRRGRSAPKRWRRAGATGSARDRSERSLAGFGDGSRSRSEACFRKHQAPPFRAASFPPPGPTADRSGSRP